MNQFTKLFNTLLTSSIWMEDDKTRILWITMLAMADKNGEVFGTVPGLARMAAIDVASCRVSLGKLMSPDPDSRTTTCEGRRIETIEGGWSIINHAKYRELASRIDSKEKATERKRRQRENEQQAGQTEKCHAESHDVTLGHGESHDVTPCHANVTLSDEKSVTCHASDPQCHAPVTPNTYIAEAEAEEEYTTTPCTGTPNVTPKIAPSRGGVVEVMKDHVNRPIETETKMQTLMARINKLHEDWTKRPHWVAKEMRALHENASAWLNVSEEDWELLTAYSLAYIPADWRKNEFDFIQYDSKTGLIGAGPSVALGHADRWKSRCRREGVPTGLETPAAPKPPPGDLVTFQAVVPAEFADFTDFD